MIEELFERPHAMRRARSGCTGPFMDAFAVSLHERGNSRTRMRSLIVGLAHLGAWLDQKGVAPLELDEAMILVFVADVRQRAAGGGKHRGCRAAARLFLAWARERGLARTLDPAVEFRGLLGDFEAWMVRHRNVSAVTLKNYRSPLRAFMAAAGDDPTRYDAAGIRRFILAETQRAGCGYGKIAVSALRMLLRYLAIHGRSAPELVEAVPTIANWKLSALPSPLAPGQVDSIISACPTTIAGRRDRAILVLLARLGLRSGDVLGLRLGDIDWANATVAVTGKGRRLVRMPLPQDVGDALIDWLGEDRPDRGDDHVFLRLRPPYEPLTNVGINNVVSRAVQRAGLKEPGIGPHRLRHSAATALLAEGVSLAGVGAVLRHQSVSTTVIYAKVDVALLQSVAGRWPTGEVAP